MKHLRILVDTRNAVVVAMLVGFSTSVQAQMASLNGRISNETGEAVVGVRVTLEGLRLGAVSDDKGTWSLQQVPAGTQRVDFDFDGFVPRSVEVDLQAGERRVVDVVLRKEGAFSLVELGPAAVEAVSVRASSPFSHVNLNADAIRARDAAVDLPFLLRFTPSVVVSSDAGAGIGYTSIRVRGSDQSRINVTINGIPLNDPESHQVYWVDLPDLGSSVDGLQIQRGAGTSTNGPGAFGATIAVNTLDFSEEPSARVVVGAGSFNSLRRSVQWQSGRLGGSDESGDGDEGQGFYVEGRVSEITSDGYMDRASSDLTSVQLGLGQRWVTGSLKYTALLGHERTYQAWHGVPEIALTGTPEEITAWAQNSDEYGYGSDTVRIADLIENGRRHNYFRYENEVDEYRQDHHQLHLEQEVGSWRSALTGHYTAGSGYYEQFRSDEDLARRRWLENELSGLAFSLHRSTDQWDLTAGAAGYSYVGDHFGKYIWMGNAGGLQPGHVYYRGVGEKSERNAFVKGAYRLNDRVHLHGEVQGREVIYTASGTDNDGLIIDVKDELTFFNPKVGLNYRCDDRHRVYASVAIANREPSRTDYVDAIDQVVPFPEKLVDYELGYQLTGTELSLEAVLFYMDYTDQLVLTGELNDVNSPLRQNVKDSYRRGIEFSVAWKPEAVRGLAWNGNATWSQNRIENFTETLYNYGDGDYVNLIPLERMDLAMSPSVVAASTLQYVIWDVPGDVPNSRKRVDVEWATKFVGKQFLDNTSSVDRMLDGYVVNDLRLRASCALASGGSLGASIFLNNVLDAMYVSNGWTYSYLYGDISSRAFENYVYPQAGRNTFVSLEYTF